MMRTRIRNRLASSATALLLAALGFGTTEPANAAADVITCTLVVSDPHPSTHQPGTANVVAAASCTKPVSSISIRVTLRDLTNSRSNTSTLARHWNKKYGTQNAALSCRNGTYQGTAYAGVILPPGYKPASFEREAASRTAGVTCRKPSPGTPVPVRLEPQPWLLTEGLSDEGREEYVVVDEFTAIFDPDTVDWSIEQRSVELSY